MSRRARNRPNKRAFGPRRQEREERSAMDHAFEQLEREKAQQQQQKEQR